ncbi:type II toxin-antitoxin system HipA family toxin YjjJ [Alkalimonas sp. MEB108]|uniref:Type II toxin-antitoxin system HipA family toxin YjjJ n=1 Tax=Alkalimonas cellulosilytica TaxID=3058395 RepID=A0ABU7JA25_9GAMM|nr:type II toxin-antitoxin system HipA family toxin YjjJ [Alkalimonas sp. MEB108]MEE2003398.1 type II toxin-antitoxin system HipA family toxin YjjJ [Alkalimonas sp. MEB108]
MASSTIDAVIDFLRREPASSSEIASFCGCDRSTVTRHLKLLQKQLVTTGRARSTRYYLRRGADAEFPLYRVSEAGQAELFGTMVAVMPRGYIVNTYHDAEFCYYDDLPWWVQDLRPQGFLGRNLAKALFRKEIVDTEDITYWKDQDIFNALLHAKGDTPGNILIGTLSYQEWLQHEPIARSEGDFVMLAEHAMSGEVVGSSAGGEQPKFCAFVDGKHRLVKFTEPVINANSQRWADLLVAEHLALNTLANAGIPATCSKIVRLEQRTFLSCARFDRIGEIGRKGLVSLRMVEMQFVGKPAEWPVIAMHLQQDKHITAEEADTIAVIWCFGRLIANTDMHNGNLSFFYSAEGELTLAPVYDMLPMAFAPSRSGAMAFDHNLTINAIAQGKHWRQAYILAERFWDDLANHVEISSDFRRVAESMRLELKAVKRLVDRMA